MDLDLYKDTFEHLLKHLPQEASLVELGCGPGNVVKYIKSKRQDLHFVGIDLAPEMIKAAQKENPGEEFRVLDIRNAGEIHGRFDAVIAAFCIPYLSFDDLPDLFSNMRRLTSEKGIIYLSCMEGAEERSGFEKTSFTGQDELYINYYPRNKIESLMKKYDFEIVKFYTKDYLEADGSTTTDLIYIARKT
jgi:cyclopropane fatty-acyl-phospholipid synthase-like methyltransferase